jgi:hypothetical protein
MALRPRSGRVESDDLAAHGGMLVVAATVSSGPSRRTPDHMLLFAISILVPLSLGGIGLLILATMLPIASPHRCLSCGYSRDGLGAGILCPECGRQPDQPPPFQTGGLSGLRGSELLLLAAASAFTAILSGLGIFLTATDALVVLAVPLAAALGTLPGFFVGAAAVRTRRDWIGPGAELRP